MARLPQPGSDSGDWGSILNDYLSQVHLPDGKLKADSVTNTALAAGAITTGAIADGAITETKLASAVQTKLNTSSVTSVNSYTGSVVLTKADLSLGNVDNTSDASKPISTAQQTAINTGLHTTDALALFNAGAYPIRASVTADSSRPVRWRGPTAPAIGGAYAISGLDIWEQSL